MSCNTKPVDPEDLDLDYNREPVCPHCGAEKRDAFEIFGTRSDDAETECDGCEKPFAVTRHVEVTYSTRKVSE